LNIRDSEAEKNRVVIAGAGVSGLFCSYFLVKNNIRVDLYDRMDRAGRKLLLAGMSGLNITRNEEIDTFSSSYGKDRGLFKSLVSRFPPDDLISLFKELGVETFTGTTGRVFPVSMNSEEFLDRLTAFLESSPLFSFYSGHTLVEITKNNNLIFESAGIKKEIRAEYAVFALGGGSRANTGSDGKWIEIFRKRGIEVLPLKPANCGFETKWSSEFREKILSSPLKNVRLSTASAAAAASTSTSTRGEVLLTGYGIEGGGIYSISREIRETIEKYGKCVLNIDLLPDLSYEEIGKKLKKPRGKNSLSNYLRKTLSISSVKFTLLKELLTYDQFVNIQSSPELIKQLQLTLTAPRPIEESISSAGGVDMKILNEKMMIRDIPGFYITGEMADWEAPTGGYLIQGCFSTACSAAEDIVFRISK
jgi:uncharacterized flavoprotein (TIGR03862 family)